ncbi:MAG: hypothetical protein Q9160_007972 [Pyrenula sp. 1 TL-2023]
MSQRNQRITSFLNTIGYPLIDHDIATWLARENWNVPIAAAAWRKHEEQKLQISGARKITVYEARHEVLANLFNRLELRDLDPAKHTMAVAMALLRKHRWNLEDALVEYEASRGDLSKYLDELEALRSRNPTQFQQDQRLAEFLTWTSMDSWYSAHEFLRSHNWDFVRAIDNVSRNHGKTPAVRGFGVTKTGFNISNEGMREVSVEYGSDNVGMRFFASVRHPQTTAGTIIDGARDKSGFPYDRTSQPANHSPLLEYFKESRPRIGRRMGWIIDDFLGSCAYENCPDPTKLRLEFIAYGNYVCRWVQARTHKRNRAGRKIGKSMPIRWEDSDSETGSEQSRSGKEHKNTKAEGKVEMDWGVAAHITEITNFRGQTLRRVTGQSSDTSTTKWEDVESQFLFQLYAEHFEEFVGKHPHKDTSKSDFMPLKIGCTLQVQWVKRFNDLFEGKTAVQVDDEVYVFENPRPERSWHSLECRARRDPGISDAFFTGKNEGEYCRRQKGKYLSSKRVDFEDLEDSDFEEDQEEVNAICQSIGEDTHRLTVKRRPPVPAVNKSLGKSESFGSEEG